VYVSNVVSINSANNFDGGGPLAVFEAYRPLGNTGLALYAAGRGSVLFGSRQLPSSQHGVVNFIAPAGGGPMSIVQEINGGATDHNVLPVGELELGGLWYHDLGGWRLFVRAAGVGQVWYNAGTAVNRSGDLGFLGGNVVFGIRY